MQVSATTDPSKPHAIELLGMQLVLWRDAAGQWHCMEDACPHRCVEGGMLGNGMRMVGWVVTPAEAPGLDNLHLNMGLTHKSK